MVEPAISRVGRQSMPLNRIQATIGTDRFSAMTSTDSSGAVCGRSVYPISSAVPKNSTLRTTAPAHMAIHISAR
jgi:hypothetical protein